VDQSNAIAYRPATTLTEPTPYRRTDAKPAPSTVVPVTTMSGLSHADQANRRQSSALTCRARNHSSWLSPRRQRKQRPEQRPHLSCPQPQWLA
jgi:hypothetical protein